MEIGNKKIDADSDPYMSVGATKIALDLFVERVDEGRRRIRWSFCIDGYEGIYGTKVLECRRRSYV